MDYRFNHFHRQHLFEGLQLGAGQPPGWSVPDFDLPTVDGGRVRKSDLMGSRPVLLTFASLTDPVAASAAPALKRLHRAFAGAIELVTVYVRESHPGDHIPQPDSLERKTQHARLLRDRDGLRWTVAVDDLDGGFHRGLGGGSSAAFIMDPNGNVAFRTSWSNDERVLRDAVKAVVNGTSGRPFERRRTIVPMALALAHVDDVVRAAGPKAVGYLRREAPLVYAAAEVAWVWHALTPVGRAALVLAGALAAASVYEGVRLLRRRGLR